MGLHMESMQTVPERSLLMNVKRDMLYLLGLIKGKGKCCQNFCGFEVLMAAQ